MQAVALRAPHRLMRGEVRQRERVDVVVLTSPHASESQEYSLSYSPQSASDTLRSVALREPHRLTCGDVLQRERVDGTSLTSPHASDSEEYSQSYRMQTV
jgi:hypothetical protein